MTLNLIHRRRFLALLAGSAVLPACQTFAQSSSPARRAKDFRILESLLYRRRPKSLGFPRVPVYGGAFWKGKDRETPYEPAVRAEARRAIKHHQSYLIDIEHWAMDIRRDSPAAVQESMRRMLQIYAWMKDEAPQLEVGVYMFPPIRDYWTPARRLPGTMEAWRKANEFLRPLAEGIDFIAPSLYTFYDNPRGWKNYAEANLVEALRFNKPVLPVLWPRFHVSNKKLRGTFIPGEFWSLQLQTVRESGASGVILWDSRLTIPNSQFDRSWDWWQRTEAFAKRL